MKIKEFYKILDSTYDFDSQDDWDNSGMMNFSSNQTIKNPVLSLDISLDTVDFAINSNSNLIISHHPIYINIEDLKLLHIKKIFNKLKTNNICTISLHTCFDKNKYGTSYQIISKLKEFEVLRSPKSPYLFFGISKNKMNLKELINKLKSNLNLEYVKLIQNKTLDKELDTKKILKIAVVGGSGGSEISTILKKDKIDYFITSEIKWHMWIKNVNDDFKILEVPHSVEKVFIDAIKKKFSEIKFIEFFPNKILSF
ncbi:MAG: Nif3-like dinuclear metal center hexameric protein [Malacoplasma sp.]|nr:Nif3-like dinuclear metal center hexameric protein [Malacoplasma sp.]